MMSKKFKTGDDIVVIAGKDRGKKGQILKVITKDAKIIVSGINIATKHLKPSKHHPNGGIIKKEMPLQVSNISHIDPKVGLPTRIGYKVLDNGRKVRYAKKSGELIDTV